jgi:GTP-binding protein
LNNVSLKVLDAKFLKSAQSIRDSLDESVSEVAFLGRSNVGKSSTINLLTNRKNLAKSSSTPGKTRLINFFDIYYRRCDSDYRVRFVDLPGFGYARVSHSLKEEWQKNLVEFIRNRIAIRLFIHLRDARHPKSRIDEDVQSYIESFLRPDQRYLTIFTKGDKLKQRERVSLLREFENAIIISNLKKSGGDRVVEEILKTIFGDIVC